MSFDVFFRDLATAKGKPLSADEERAVSRTVQAFGGPIGPDEHGYVFDSPRAGAIEFYVGSTSGGMLALRDWGSGKADFIHALCAATDWAAAVPAEPLLIMATHPLSVQERERLANTEFEFRLIANGADVLAGAQAAFGSWANHRDQVVKGN